MASAEPNVNADRGGRIAYVADHLLLHAGALVRLLVKESASEITRSEAGVLFTLSRGPRRITELAELEGLAQPTMTALVKRLERRGCVKRDRPADDGRVVLLSLTPAGTAALEAFRAQVGAAVRADLDVMTDEQIAALEAATEALGTLVDVLQTPRDEPAQRPRTVPPAAAKADEPRALSES
jgi:DNA-binding MarR family transcriptional regulator